MPPAPPLPSSNELLHRVLRAQVYPTARQTELERADRLSDRLGREVLLKREDRQDVFSFKVRGAVNKMRALDATQLANGVVCSSAGNHAQGVALAARQMKTEAVVFMPRTTPQIKIDAVRALGAEVQLTGDSYDDAQSAARQRCEELEATFVHPFDDLDVIAGQGTIGLELLRQLPRPAARVYVPIGGGGLVSGLLSSLSAVHPETEVVGVEHVESPGMTRSLEAGRPIELDHVGIFADGVAVRRVGDLPFAICQRHGLRIVQVDTDAACGAIRALFEDTRTLVEPAGALATAGMLLDSQAPAADGPLVALVCGANVNFDRLRHIAERAAVGDRREILLGVQIPEEPGAFRTFCAALGDRHVTEFNYRYRDAGSASIFVGLETLTASAGDERRDLIGQLRGHGYQVIDLTTDEMAQLHLRHLVGGSSVHITDERLYRFEFPERRGALQQFLDAVGREWNISLFHYRNHGSDFGRVLCGIQVPAATRQRFEQHLDRVGYARRDETDNPAYALFLRPPGAD